MQICITLHILELVNNIKPDDFSVLLVLSSFVHIFIQYSENCAVGIVTGSFWELAPRKTNVKHHGGSVGSMVANLCGGRRNLVVVTTLSLSYIICLFTLSDTPFTCTIL